MTMLQFIDSSGNQVGDISQWMIDCYLDKLGTSYNATAIMGIQSSGKSTLLNELYGTSFPTMNAVAGHTRTTHGIWLSHSLNASGNTTLILDVEGTDSKERGENNLTFERRSALFTLAVSNCLIINVWYNNLGNCVGSNYSLVQTVLEANLELFCNDPNSKKKALVFVVRDWPVHWTSLEILKTEVKENYVDKIWKAITKPENWEDLNIEDFFYIETIGLPHINYENKLFKASIKELNKLLAAYAENEAFLPVIPADAFGAYCHNIWSIILKQAHLDIPSLKEMVSIYRCQEIKQTTMADVMPELKEQQQLAQERELPNFCQWAEKLSQLTVENFRASAKRYNHQIVQSVEEELIDLLFLELQRIADIQFHHVNYRLIKRSQEAFQRMLPTLNPNIGENSESALSEAVESWSKFNDICLLMKQTTLDSFDSIVLENTVTIFNTPYQFFAATARDTLLSTFENEIDALRAKQLSMLLMVLRHHLHQTLKPVQCILHENEISAKVFWQRATALVSSASDQSHELLSAAWNTLQTTHEHAIDNTVHSFFKNVCAEEAIKQLRSIMEHAAYSLAMWIDKRFDKLFNYEDGLPRDWSNVSASEMKELFQTARDGAFEALTIFVTVELDIPEILPTENGTSVDFQKPFLNVQAEQKIREEAIQRMQIVFRNGQVLQQSNATNSWRQIPFYFWAILLIFAWDEIMSLFAFVFSKWVLLILLIVIPYLLMAWYGSELGTISPLALFLLSRMKEAIKRLFLQPTVAPRVSLLAPT